MRTRYYIVEFPQTQLFEEHERFSECMYVGNDYGLAVPEDLYKEVMNPNNTNIERILCAAVKRKIPHPREPYESDTNDICKVELGYRHHDIWMRFSKNELSPEPEDRGFFTSKGRYVNRKEAYAIALLAGQISREDGESILISEDLY